MKTARDWAGPVLILGFLAVMMLVNTAANRSSETFRGGVMKQHDEFIDRLEEVAQQSEDLAKQLEGKSNQEVVDRFKGLDGARMETRLEVSRIEENQRIWNELKRREAYLPLMYNVGNNHDSEEESAGKEEDGEKKGGEKEGHYQEGYEEDCSGASYMASEWQAHDQGAGSAIRM